MAQLHAALGTCQCAACRAFHDSMTVEMSMPVRRNPALDALYAPWRAALAKEARPIMSPPDLGPADIRSQADGEVVTVDLTAARLTVLEPKELGAALACTRTARSAARALEKRMARATARIFGG